MTTEQIEDEYVALPQDFVLKMFGLTDRSEATGMAKTMLDAYYAGFDSSCDQ